jgi:hypothetical protein
MHLGKPRVELGSVDGSPADSTTVAFLLGGEREGRPAPRDSVLNRARHLYGSGTSSSGTGMRAVGEGRGWT